MVFYGPIPWLLHAPSLNFLLWNICLPLSLKFNSKKVGLESQSSLYITQPCAQRIWSLIVFLWRWALLFARNWLRAEHLVMGKTQSLLSKSLQPNGDYWQPNWQVQNTVRADGFSTECRWAPWREAKICGSFPDGEHVGIQGVQLAQRAWELTILFPLPCPVHLLPLTVPKRYPFILTNNLILKQMNTIKRKNCHQKGISEWN